MKKLFSALIFGSIGLSASAFANTGSIRDVAAALDMTKKELENGTMSTFAAPAAQDLLSIESLVAAGARVESYEISKDLIGKCMVTFKISTGTTKSYAIEDKRKSYFGTLCP